MSTPDPTRVTARTWVVEHAEEIADRIAVHQCHEHDAAEPGLIHLYREGAGGGFNELVLCIPDPAVTREPVADDMLTSVERDTIRMIGEVHNNLSRIAGHGPTRHHDLGETVAHVHALQHVVMAQAAARAYPDLYRLMGVSHGARLTR